MNENTYENGNVDNRKSDLINQQITFQAAASRFTFHDYRFLVLDSWFLILDS